MRVIASVYKTKVNVKVYDYPYRKTILILKDLPFRFGAYRLEFRTHGYVFCIDFYRDRLSINCFTFDIDNYSERHFKGCTVYVLDCSIKDLFSKNEKS